MKNIKFAFGEILLLLFFGGILVSAQSGSLAVAMNASRTSCVAPCAVFFDGLGTTASSTTKPFHELDYSWNFGDTNAGLWWDEKSKNSAKGAVAGHVFESAGTFNVVLNVKDAAGNSDSKNINIVVSDPNTVFSGTNTICFSNTNNFLGCPNGAQQVALTTFTNLGNYFAAGRRLLLHRGDVWTTSTPFYMNVPGPGILGAYGDCANVDVRGICSNNPKIIASGNNNVMVFSEQNFNTADWRIMDLQVEGLSATGVQGILANGHFENYLFYRMRVRGFSSSIWFGSSILVWWNDHGSIWNDYHNSIAVVESDLQHLAADGIAGVLLYGSGKRIMYLGNLLNDSILGQHVLRQTFMSSGVISDNWMGNQNAGRHVVKLHTLGWNSILTNGQPNLGYHTYSEKIIISDNVFKNSELMGADWCVGLGPENPNEDERLRDIIVERNIFLAGAGQQRSLVIWAQNTTIRNNIFDLTGARAKGGVDVNRRGVEPAPIGTEIYDNTVYSGDSGSYAFYGFVLGAPVSATTVRNNLVSAPFGSGDFRVIYDFGSSGLIQGNNLLTASPGFVNAAGKDFHLLLTSVAKDAGYSIINYEDKDGNPRPVGNYDLGAYEYQGPCTNGATMACPLTQGVCAGVRITCSGGVWSTCSYGGNYQTSETSCSDGLDNDCDGLVDGADSNCVVPTCNDGIQNQGETGIDCGGPCAACVVVDTTAPNLLNVGNGSVSNVSANIVWTTNENANATVMYGLTSGLGLVVGRVILSTTHAFTLTGLTNGTRYYYRVRSCDAIGNCNQSSLYNFTTAVNYVDSVGPVIILTSPENGFSSKVNDIIFKYTANDVSGIKNCSMNVIGIEYFNGSVVSGAEVNVGLNLVNGNYVWNVTCFDIFGNSGFNSSSLFVNYVAPCTTCGGGNTGGSTGGNGGGSGGSGGTPAGVKNNTNKTIAKSVVAPLVKNTDENKTVGEKVGDKVEEVAQNVDDNKWKMISLVVVVGLMIFGAVGFAAWKHQHNFGKISEEFREQFGN